MEVDCSTVWGEIVTAEISGHDSWVELEGTGRISFPHTTLVSQRIRLFQELGGMRRVSPTWRDGRFDLECIFCLVFILYYRIGLYWLL